MYIQYDNAIFHTMEEKNPREKTLLVLNGRIIFCGNGNEINLPATEVQRIDCRGLHIYPGFIDCHTHVAWTAIDKERLRLDDCQTLDAALKKIKDHLEKTDKGRWVLGGGWNANLWQDGIPHKSQLDALSEDHMIALFNKDAHTQWLNSAALKEVHFTNMTTDPPGGRLGRDESGELTGLIYEKACDIVSGISDNISLPQLQRCLQNYAQELFSLGITSVHSCESLQVWALFQELNQKGRLALRICMHPPVEEAGTFTKAGICSGWGDEFLRLGGLKYFVDGSLGSQTAEMFRRYETLDHAGVEVITESALTAQLRQTAEKGFSATIHAIGDKANWKALNALEKIQDLSKKRRLRHRIEHAQIVRKKDIKRFAKAKVIASMQPLHVADDIKIADKYLGKRAENAYPVASLLRSGCTVVFGSDIPVTDPDPMKGISAAVNRKFGLDDDEPVWHPNECISVSQALRAYTKQAAYASYEEHLKGTLSVGKLADFTGFSENLEMVGKNELKKIRPKMTVLAGNIVYQRD